MSLTRADLESSKFQRLFAEAQVDLHILSEAELQASMDELLVTHPDYPVADEQDVWIFAYGSLIWNPAFHYKERWVGNIYGWHRRFCLWTEIGRARQNSPGWCWGLIGVARVGGLSIGLRLRMCERNCC